MRRAVRAVDVAPVAIATDARLRAAIRLRAEKKSRHIVMAATTALVMRPPMAWTRAIAAAILPLQSCLCTVSGTAPKQNRQVMGRRRACLPIPAGSYRASAEFPEQKSTAGPPPGLPRWVHRLLPPLRFAVRKGRSAPGAGPSYGLPSSLSEWSFGRFWLLGLTWRALAGCLAVEAAGRRSRWWKRMAAPIAWRRAPPPPVAARMA